MSNNLSMMLMVAVLAAFTGTTTYAQQTLPQPQQQVPVTPEGIPPPAEITPAHPLAPSTDGAASRPTGSATAKPIPKDDNQRDRDRER